MKLKSILSLLGSAVISYVLFYFVTSEFIYRVYSGSSELIVPLMIALLIAQTAIIFMIIRLITDKTVDRSCVIILWIAYAFAMAFLIRKTCDRLPGAACDLRFEPAIHDPDSSESDLFYAGGVFVQKTVPEQNDCDINPADIVC